MADEDEAMMGEAYVSMTVSADGDYPFFTVPVRWLECLGHG
jgi:hypothetical protein